MRNWDIVPLPNLGRGASDTSSSITKAIEASRAKAKAAAAKQQSPKGQQGKRKWGKPMAPAFVPPASDSSDDDDDPVAAAKKARRAQRFGAGYADGAVAGASGVTQAPKVSSVGRPVVILSALRCLSLLFRGCSCPRRL